MIKRVRSVGKSSKPKLAQSPRSQSQSPHLPSLAALPLPQSVVSSPTALGGKSPLPASSFDFSTQPLSSATMRPPSVVSSPTGGKSPLPPTILSSPTAPGSKSPLPTSSFDLSSQPLSSATIRPRNLHHPSSSASDSDAFNQSETTYKGNFFFLKPFYYLLLVSLTTLIFFFFKTNY